MWVDKEDNRVGMSTSEYTRMLNKLFDNAGFKSATSHSLRKSATKWAARCGQPDHVIIATGRWRGRSDNFLLYVQAGRDEMEKYKVHKEKDPIRQLWVFKPCRFDSMLG